MRALAQASCSCSVGGTEKAPQGGLLVHMARPERFELPTSWFVAMRSIQLSYGRNRSFRSFLSADLAEREGFEPSMGFRPIHP